MSYLKNKEFIEYAKTHSINEIAEKFNISKSWLYVLSKRYGVDCLKNKIYKPRGKAGSKADMITCLIKNGFTYKSIGELFGVSRQYIDTLAHRNIENTADLVI